MEGFFGSCLFLQKTYHDTNLDFLIVRTCQMQITSCSILLCVIQKSSIHHTIDFISDLPGYFQCFQGIQYNWGRGRSWWQLWVFWWSGIRRWMLVVGLFFNPSFLFSLRVYLFLKRLRLLEKMKTDLQLIKKLGWKLWFFF